MLQCIKHLIDYLYGCPYCTVRYTYGLDGNKTHELRQEVSPGGFHPQDISNGLVGFADGVEICASNNVHWSAKIQPASEAHSTESEVHIF